MYLFAEIYFVRISLPSVMSNTEVQERKRTRKRIFYLDLIVRSVSLNREDHLQRNDSISFFRLNYLLIVSNNL